MEGSRSDVTGTSARFSKFVIRCGILGHELRKPKGTSNSIKFYVPLLDLKFLRWTASRAQDFQIGGTRTRGACVLWPASPIGACDLPGERGRAIMVRKMRGLLAYGSSKPQQKPSFKQRYNKPAAPRHHATTGGIARERPSRLSARTFDVAQSNLPRPPVAQRLATLQAAEWLIDVLKPDTLLERGALAVGTRAQAPAPQFSFSSLLNRLDRRTYTFV